MCGFADFLMITGLNPHISCHLDDSWRESVLLINNSTCVHSHALTFTRTHFLITVLMIYFLLLCFPLLSFSSLPSPLPLSLPLSLPSLCADSQVVSSCQKHTLPLTHGWQRETEGVRESTGLTHTLLKRKRQPAICGRSLASLQLCWNQWTALNSVRTSENHRVS